MGGLNSEWGCLSASRWSFFYPLCVISTCLSAVRVHSGKFNTSGIVEVAVDQQYYPVCTPASAYTQETANVACHHLTGSPTSSAIRVKRSIFGSMANSVLHANFSCTGTEQRLQQCMTDVQTTHQSSGGYCSYPEIMVAVVCYEGARPAGRVVACDNSLVKKDAVVMTIQS